MGKWYMGCHIVVHYGADLQSCTGFVAMTTKICAKCEISARTL